MKKNQGYLAIFGVIALIAVLCYQAVVGFTDAGSSASNIKQGLDLAGGVSITYQVVGDETPSAEDMSDTKKKLEDRVQQYSTEAIVYQEGDNRFSIEIPGITDADEILAELGRPGALYFIAETDSDGNYNYAIYEGVDENGNYNFSSGGVTYYYALTKTIEELEEDGSIVLYGTDVADAQAGTYSGTTGTEYIVQLTLTDEGAEKFAVATEKAAGKETIGIYYDGSFKSVPSVNSAITDGVAQISGMDSYAEAEALASTIRIGSLSLELEEVYNKVVGAQLGGEALEKSLQAGAVGLIIIIVFMIAVYFLPGFCAGLALCMYVPAIVVLIHGFDLTLTLPGVAGIILSIGMAVDANVIIFARIREELAAGKTVKSSIKTGFDKAFSAILDGNVTTMIAALVLMVMGSGVIRGFAQTLMLGIALSMFTSLVITRLLVNAFYAIGFKDKKLYGVGKEHKTINFLGKRHAFFALSGVLIALGVAFMVYHGANGEGSLNFGLEFSGGTSTSVIFEDSVTLEWVEEEIVPLFEEVTGSGSIQVQVVDGGEEVVIKTLTLTQEEREELRVALVENYGVNDELITSETISSTISSETRRETVIAVLVAVVCMLIYIRLRFSDLRFGISAVAALVHDVLIVLGFYAISRITVGNTFIACILTIVGYSINATIVIFDRIRENLKEAKKNAKTEDIVNSSITQTLSRSIFTSLTTFVKVACLYAWGVTSIREFALPLMIGIVCGTYSSVCLTGSLWYLLHERTGKRSG
ncbi:MAG: protein translocase subunit SecD [Lachnospiraceae bacterium]|nr:protein translocase subunit SecD [Lachnospiraceae bacterium]